MIIGAAALLWSVYSSSPLLAFIGLGLVFWGAILTYVRSSAYVKKTVFDATALSSTTHFSTHALGFKGAAVYLPPRFLHDPKRSKVFVARQEAIILPEPQQVQEHEEPPLFELQDGLILDPYGSELSALFEKTLGIDFVKTDLTYFERNIPKMLIDQLEIATNVETSSTAETITIKLQDSIFEPPREPAQTPSTTVPGIGSILASAIACSLAKGTGKPITIEKEEISEDGRTTTIEYRMLADRSE